MDRLDSGSAGERVGGGSFKAANERLLALKKVEGYWVLLGGEGGRFQEQ